MLVELLVEGGGVVHFTLWILGKLGAEFHGELLLQLIELILINFLLVDASRTVEVVLRALLVEFKDFFLNIELIV